MLEIFAVLDDVGTVSRSHPRLVNAVNGPKVLELPKYVCSSLNTLLLLGRVGRTHLKLYFVTLLWLSYWYIDCAICSVISQTMSAVDLEVRSGAGRITELNGSSFVIRYTLIQFGRPT
jgi:hypothetical protein